VWGSTLTQFVEGEEVPRYSGGGSLVLRTDARSRSTPGRFRLARWGQRLLEATTGHGVTASVRYVWTDPNARGRGLAMAALSESVRTLGGAAAVQMVVGRRDEARQSWAQHVGMEPLPVQMDVATIAFGGSVRGVRAAIYANAPHLVPVEATMYVGPNGQIH
jgi:hypothetical protein